MHCEAYHRMLTSDMQNIEGPISVRCDMQGNVTE